MTPVFLELERINKIRSGSDYILLSKILISRFQRFSPFHVFMSMDSVAEIMYEFKVSLFVLLLLLLILIFFFFTLEDVDLLRFDLIRDLRVLVKYCCFEFGRMMGAYQSERWFLLCLYIRQLYSLKVSRLVGLRMIE